MADASLYGGLPGQSNRAIRRQVYALAVPIAVNNLLQRGVGVVDTVMVGHVGANQLAAVGLSQILILSATAFVYCLAIGSAVLVARHTGAEEYDPRRWVGNTALTGSVFVGRKLGGSKSSARRWMNRSISLAEGDSDQTSTLSV